MKIKKGFTLLEILVVIVLIGILAGIVLVAVNPTRQLAQARDSVREGEVSKMQKALEEYALKNGNDYPAGVTATLTDICDTGSNTVGQGSVIGGCVDLRPLVPNYLFSIPKDPLASGGVTGYRVRINNNKISIQANLAETRVIGWNL